MLRKYLKKLAFVFAFILSACQNDNIINSITPPVTTLPKEDCHKIFVDGYTDRVSYRVGQTVTALLNFISDTSVCKLNIHRLDGSIAFSVASPTIKQVINSSEPSSEGFGYKPTLQITLPNDLKSGIYLIENSIPFVVKPSSAVDVLVLYPSNTINAYSHVGGKSMYDPPATRITHASFLRPSAIQWQSEVFLKWIDNQSGFTVGYICDLDMDELQNIPSSKILIIPGHSEYWTRTARHNFDSYVDQGHHAIILSGNTMWWQVRYSDDKSIMYCYRDATLDPETDPLLKTITWDLTSLAYPIIPFIGADFNHGGYGLYTDNGWDGFKIVNPQSPLLEGVGLQKGAILQLPSGEYDGAPVLNFDTDGFPVLDVASTGFKKLELIGFDKGARGGAETIGTFIVGRKNETSGIIINAGTYDWCSYRGMGGTDGDKIKTITTNCIKKLLNGDPVFTN